MIKSKTASVPKTEYPCLKEYKGEDGHYIILFTAKNTGTVVGSTHGFFELGSYSEDWREYEFVNFNGKVELEN